jgi:hypothetical protein
MDIIFHNYNLIFLFFFHIFLMYYVINNLKIFKYHYLMEKYDNQVLFITIINLSF